MEKNAKKDIGEYSFKNDDYFDRFDFAKNITKNIILDKSFTSNKVIALNGQWGCGKTQLTKMWINEMMKDKFNDNSIELENYKCIYYSAWEHDDWKEPLSPIIYTLKEHETFDDSIDQYVDAIGKHIVNQGVGVIKGVGKVALKAILKKASIDPSDVDAIIKSFKDVGSIVEHDKLQISEEFSNYKKAKESLKKHLKAKSSDNKKIIFFIDEMDRCKPDFAIKTLETIKHFFDIDNFIFVFSIDMSQLSHSISQVYGENTDSSGYLNRFFDYIFNIADPHTSKYIDRLLEFNGVSMDDGLIDDEEYQQVRQRVLQSL